MVDQNTVKETVIKSLVAVGSAKEAKFYANLFRNISAEKFALIAIDACCLKNPLLEAFISDLKILSNLGLTPVLLVGALDEDKTTVRFQVERLCSALDGVNIMFAKRNCASYQFIPDIAKIAKNGRFPILEITEKYGMGLEDLVFAIQPSKLIFLQPSGGFWLDGQRLPVVDLGRCDALLESDQLGVGQVKFIKTVKSISKQIQFRCTFVMASPLNLLTELFTTKGSGTLLRKSAHVKCLKSFNLQSKIALRASIEGTFERKLASNYFKRPVSGVYLEQDLRGGAIVSNLAGLPYLNKFWVVPEAQGEGIAQDIWHTLISNTPAFFWRSRMSNPFNNWYMKMCDGMQINGEWRVFWKGLEAPEISGAIRAAVNAPIDFEE
ncbi:MAG: hypothetical protein V3U57_05315 [Robiginitomaculum sp.]